MAKTRSSVSVFVHVKDDGGGAAFLVSAEADVDVYVLENTGRPHGLAVRVGVVQAYDGDAEVFSDSVDVYAPLEVSLCELAFAFACSLDVLEIVDKDHARPRALGVGLDLGEVSAVVYDV